jgi:hypothetical protein
VSKRGWSTLGVIALLGIWLFVAGYWFLEKKHALWQKRVNAAKEEQRRCEIRNMRFKITANRVLTAPPAIPDVWARIWTDAFNRVREGQSETDVEEILGQPLYTRCDVNHAGDKFEGSVWQYTIALPPNMVNSIKNNTIQIEFGPDGKVVDKSMMHVVNLYMKPSLSPSGTATPAGSPVTAVNK